MAYKINRDTLISEILEKAPETAPLFREIGMHCLGCAMAKGETVAMACRAHSVDVNSFVEKANAAIEEFAS
ncbi:MAG: DUF1858 domain-containing protein [Clostridiales bacterium]|nr:DUF1858 domain-containing protein [Clostridiales bacterium]